MVLTSRWPPLSSTAYTLPATRLLTKSVPLSPHVMTRALLMPLAQSDTLKPRGTLILSTGISPGALGAGGWAMGASVESAMLAGWPCFQGGGGVACWAGASWASESPTRVATASEVRMMRRMVTLLLEDGDEGDGERLSAGCLALPFSQGRTIRPVLAGCQPGWTVAHSQLRGGLKAGSKDRESTGIGASPRAEAP